MPEQAAPPAPAPFNLTKVDREVLAQTDEEFIYHDWEGLKDIIKHNRLEVLKRKPSDLRRYITWTAGIKEKYSSITNYICQERLRWDLSVDPNTQCHNPIPFADARDYKILRNDWPYGVTPDITHLVVWVKNYIDVKPENGDVTDESRAMIEDFVYRIFVKRLEREFPDARERVQWFKNWTALQSVRTLEHMHILVRGVPDEIIVEWTGETAGAMQSLQ